jgi:hypothetical protein
VIDLKTHEKQLNTKTKAILMLKSFFYKMPDVAVSIITLILTLGLTYLMLHIGTSGNPYNFNYYNPAEPEPEIAN